MAGLLPMQGQVSYNGFFFSASMETTELRISPQYSEDQRTVIFNRYRITIRDVITGRPTDSKCVNARRQLTKNAGAFSYLNRGLGPIQLNTSGVRDVQWGPKPIELSMIPIGGRNATEIIWSVEFSMPDCSQAKYAFAPMEFNFSVSFEIDSDGLTTRTYSGFIRIPMTRNNPNDRLLSDNIDLYREQIAIPLLPQFKRTTPMRWAISPDKTKATFTQVDTEFFGPPPPPGVTDWDGSHVISSSEAGLVKWTGAIQASYKVAPGFSHDVAAQHFLNLVTDRIAFSAAILGKSRQSFILLTFQASEPQLSGPNNTAFSLSYSFVTTLNKILSGSGLWRPIPNSNWQLWAASMETVLGPRGLAGLRFRTNEDRITDLCDTGTVLSPTGRGEIRELRSVVDIFVGNCPPSAESWISYENEIEVEADDGVSPLRRVPTQPITKSFSVDLVSGGGFGVPILPSNNNNGFPTAKTQVPLWGNVFNGAGVLESQFQQRTTPQVFVYLVGRAARACYPIPMPEFVEDDQFKPVSANRLDRGEGFKQSIKYSSGLPIYVATWRLRFAIEKHNVSTLPVPKNPLAARKAN